MPNDRNIGNEPIAIVGSACRFPGDAISPSKLWELVKEPRDVLSLIPKSRFNAAAFYHPDGSHHGTSNVRHSYVLSDDIRYFDAQFFGTKPVEANAMDPQQRLLLEAVYEGMESAGIPMEKLRGSNTGVYVGVMTNDYGDLMGKDIQMFPTYFASGISRCILANRISYFFDWHGPSMTVDTACSASLTAMHQAVQSLRSGEANVVVAAGSNLLLGPEQYVAESKLKMLSPNGRSKMWDKDADGYARGEGIAAVILKRLSDALADGDHIECVVRETGVNQDGKTKGITMPSPSAQADLIRSTYERAGLDLSKASDRPQYFEAHGTGTPAGDPVEAEAISTAFFGSQPNYYRDDTQEPPLYVGSIKTIIGHTEGTAGLAAVLKASLALQHGIPFYGNLRILDEAQKWPERSPRAPRRASVNSFGFGGANAHAILESFENTSAQNESVDEEAEIFTPFNFSAASEKSLMTNLKSYFNFLTSHPMTNLQDLSWTLNCRRSTLPVRLSIAASSVDSLIYSLDQAAQSPSSNVKLAGQTTSMEAPKLLAVFTGQGAQWAAMGAELITSSNLATNCIARLDRSLQALPVESRPKWSLKDEILKDKTSSRISEALFSQTICTAIQILLVDLLEAAGVSFTAVVGHSSGEIAAGYAAGYISAEDAIRVAYYRGWSLQYAASQSGANGAMMAVGTSFEDAKELCAFEDLDGRLCVAASNSPTSVTLSGDADAIEEAKYILEDENKFVRLLKVDRAYHSHHMLPCASPYIDATRKCGIEVLCPSEDRPRWISSVYGKDIKEVQDSLRGEYWSNNMIHPVLFSDALAVAIKECGPFDMAIEIGPHPALKGPGLETITERIGRSIPYSGTLSRGKNSREAFASALGDIWASIGENVVDFSSFQHKMIGSKGKQERQPLKGLPSYSWDHDRTYWHESRMSLEFKNGNVDHFHSLLGTKTPDATPMDLRWRNFLFTRELPWLKHHQVQGQIVFPAAGYISAAVEIILEEYGLGSIQLIEFNDTIIGQALLLDEAAGVEVIFTLKITETIQRTVKGVYNCYSAPKKTGTPMLLHASAQVSISLGPPTNDILPAQDDTNEIPLAVDPKRFYDSVSDLGFGYTGPFHALSDLRRRMDEATGKIAVPLHAEYGAPLLIHPAPLDAALQAIMLAYSFPGDGRMLNIQLPTKIDRLRINPKVLSQSATPGSYLPFRSSAITTSFSDLSGDVDMYSSDGVNTAIQLEGLHTTPLTPFSSENDVPMFTKVTWNLEAPAQRKLETPVIEFAADYTLSLDLERISHHYLRRLHQTIPLPENTDIAQHHKYFLKYASYCAAHVQSGSHPFAKPEWADDTADDILKVFERHAESFEVKLIRQIGEDLPSIVTGRQTLLDVIVKDRSLERFYRETFGIDTYLQELGSIAGLISNRYPHMKILEIGAGEGEATESILREIGTAFTSYTCTDFLKSQVENLHENLQGRNPRMAFQVLDIEKDIADQGYAEESFDLVVASMSLYATKCLQTTLANVRRLIKPGGYLILLEATDPNVMRLGLILGSLQAWWMGHSEGRNITPFVSVQKWNELLKSSGFSGIDRCMPHSKELPVPFSLMVAQATDDRVDFLRDPVAVHHAKLGVKSLTIVGGKTPSTSALVSNIKKAVSKHYESVSVSPSLSDIIPDELPVMGTVLSLTELDEPFFPSMTPNAFKSFQSVFERSENVLWVAHGAQGPNPFGKMLLGVQRTAAVEMPHLRQQFLNFCSGEDVSGDLIAERLLVFEALNLGEQDKWSGPLLWSAEPEIYFKDGDAMIPRVKLDSTRNDRYNSNKRLIIKDSDRRTLTVTVQQSGNRYMVLEQAPVKSTYSDRIQINVSSSLLRSVRVTETDHLFLLVGSDAQTNHFWITLSEQLASRVDVPRSWLIKCGESKAEAMGAMLKVYNQLLAQSLIGQALPGSKVAVIDPDFSLAAVLQEYSHQSGVELVLFTTTENSCCLPWIFIHPNHTQRGVRDRIPKNITKLLSIGDNNDVLSRISASLPAHCKVETEMTITMQDSQYSSALSRTDQVALHLQHAWNRASCSPSPINLHRLPILGISEVIESSSANQKQSILSWEGESLPVQILPASKKVKFAGDKTYWLIGLTAGLGLTLFDGKWIQKMVDHGCTVRVFANDITDRESVYSTYHKIVETMPPVGGVAQGAMVLQDTMLLDLDLPRVESVLRPKVQGSLLLDELFSEDTLDFMIFFASMAAITGSAGQTAYNAANMFMTSLAAQRQKRGLASQAINIGAIVGNGYVTRELQLEQQKKVQEVGSSWMSEQDFQEIFAEGVISCMEEKGTSEICCCLKVDDDDTKDWIMNPMFQHLVSKSNAMLSVDKKNRAGVMVKTQLLEATSHEEVLDIIKVSFTLKLQSALDTDPSKSVLELTPDELGVDSLVAVDLRSWFLKELAVDMPMLKIFSAGSISELLESSIDMVPAHLIPKVKLNTKTDEPPSKDADSRFLNAPAIKTVEDLPRRNKRKHQIIPFGVSPVSGR
ncbi:hypothetical protein N7468_002621 [Penicillium chermesinum]|uniref:Uncharacterized protein n=1 Tax=Penicillium chermesinum TaxID=63820 RepID=A0A9W9PIV8_9EURO|nr:uncharacterized protein N7468_002621 [Penicillium chermesinum]KAJ5247638.1 hypothetical protein N7468_002621 [Penicillium chermesinum]